MGYIVFSSWFLQFVLAWLAENEEVSVEFMHGALERDKREGVSRNTREGFSQCLTLIQRVELPLRQHTASCF